MRSPLSTVLCLLVSASLSSRAAEPARSFPFPKTQDGIHLEQVFNLQQFLHGTWSEETGVVDQVWGSYSATLPPGMYNSFYVPISVDDGFSSNSHTVAWYQANHPDWLEYLCDQSTLAFQFDDTDRAPLDFANPAVRAYQWSSAIDPALAAGYQSVAVDELSLFNDFHRCGHFDSASHWVQQYGGNGTDARFRRDVLKWQKLTYRHIHRQSHTATMQLNRPYDLRSSADDNHLVMTTTDLLFDEGGFTNYGLDGDNYPGPAEWETIVGYLDYVQSQGICYTTNGEEPEATEDITPAERQWVIGNYLLVKNNCTYMYMTHRQGYGDIVTFPEYDIAIGRPKGAKFQTQGVWERKFTGGLTLVNPYDTTAVVTLPRGHWTDVNGGAVSSPVTLAHQAALILLKAD